MPYMGSSVGILYTSSPRAADYNDYGYNMSVHPLIIYNYWLLIIT